MTTASKPLSTWAPIAGYWQLDNNLATFSGGLASPRGILLGHSRFSSGTVRATISLSDDADDTAGCILLGYISPAAPYITVGIGGGEHEAYVVSKFDPNQGWNRLEGVGERPSLQPNRPYAVEVGAQGQRLSLSVDGIRILTHILPQPLEIGQLGLFAWGSGTVAFESVSVSARPTSAFVVMQFTPPFDELFEDVIRPVCAEMDIEAYRASDIYRPGVIIQDIIQGLGESQVVIAEITPANPNVFYELGYSHALRKPTILLANREETNQLPFDLSGFRVIFYDNTIRGKSGVESDLRRHLITIRDNGFRTSGVTI